MTTKKKVVFIGGLSNGKIVYEYLLKQKKVNLSLTITYPDEYHGPRHTKFPDDETIIKTTSACEYCQKIALVDPDLIIVAGWSELLSDEILGCAKHGVIGFHPSKLPLDRGRSVLAWQIEEGYTDSALTMFYYTSLPDGGDIIGFSKFHIDSNDYINDVLNKIDDATIKLLKYHFPSILEDKVLSFVQDHKKSTWRRLRNEADREINWDSNSDVILRKIRAISRPYPGAIGLTSSSNKYTVWRAEIIKNFHFGDGCIPGTEVALLFDDTLIIKTRDSFLRLCDFERSE